ncbi:MAG: hypothetical protein JRI71_11340 [Deltaproteobacteria bacterium]|nr:hypothetical protein [Deltaproteobacteria bacterium]MBW2311106.1 hypothetical protein [Deltaproteobacteria bacterium]
MPNHLVAYRDILGIPTGLIYAYRSTIFDTIKDGYHSQKAFTAIPPLLNSLLTSFGIRIESLSSQGRSIKGMRSPVY